MRAIFVFIMVAYLISICGCGSCIRVGGAYKDYSGEIEYCFSEKSAPGAPVIEETSEKGVEEFYGFSGDEISTIIGLVDSSAPSASRVSASYRNPAERLRSMISERKKEK